MYFIVWYDCFLTSLMMDRGVLLVVAPSFRDPYTTWINWLPTNPCRWRWCWMMLESIHVYSAYYNICIYMLRYVAFFIDLPSFASSEIHSGPLFAPRWGRRSRLRGAPRSHSRDLHLGTSSADSCGLRGFEGSQRSQHQETWRSAEGPAGWKCTWDDVCGPGADGGCAKRGFLKAGL